MSSVLSRFWLSNANRALVVMACIGVAVSLADARPDFFLAIVVTLFVIARRLDDAVKVCRGSDR